MRVRWLGCWEVERGWVGERDSRECLVIRSGDNFFVEVVDSHSGIDDKSLCVDSCGAGGE